MVTFFDPFISYKHQEITVNCQSVNFLKHTLLSQTCAEENVNSGKDNWAVGPPGWDLFYFPRNINDPFYFAKNK
jgi:hypothetical protein